MQLCLAPLVGLNTTSSPPLPRSCLSYHDHKSSCRAASANQAPPVSSAHIPLIPRQFKNLTANQSMLAALLLPAAAACTILTACPAPVEAGILSGSQGLESIELPSIPGPEMLKKMKEGTIEKYKNFDANFKKSPFLAELLKKSQENKEKHKKEIEDKYCMRGADWGVGDCSLVGLPQADREAVLEKLRQAGKEGQ